MITELIEFKLKDAISKTQIQQRADHVVNEFHKKQEGFIDFELISNAQTQAWQMIIHYQCMDNIEKVKENIPNSTALNEFRQLVEPDSMKVSFHEMEGKWSA